MLIGIDASRSVTQQRTGTEAYAYYLIQALISRTAGGPHRLRLYFNQPPVVGDFPETDHVECRIMPFARLWTQVRLAGELAAHPPDVFFTPAHVIPFLYRGASVATVHDLGYHYFPDAHTRSQAAYLALSTRANGRAARQLVADSMATRDDLVTLYGIDQQKINVVYPGRDPRLERVTDADAIAAAMAKYQIKPPYLLYIGTLQPRKNIVRIVQAFARAAVPGQLVLGGKKGWHTEPIRRAIAELDWQTQQRILLPGYIDEEDKGALLSGARALVFPSLYEGFGFPVLEAQACGTPVLTARSSSLPEISQGSAILVHPLDVEDIAAGMERIASDELLRRELVKKGYENVRRFDWHKAADAVIGVLERALAR